MQKERVDLRGVKVFLFTSFHELLSYVSGKQGILVAIDAEKILHATPQTIRLKTLIFHETLRRQYKLELRFLAKKVLDSYSYCLLEMNKV